MALGKYSPTVDVAYRHDQEWFDKYSNCIQYDPEGYDEYGYDKDNKDRSGHYEYEYNVRCNCCGQINENLYLNIKFDWGFDGVKPVRERVLQNN